MNYLDKAVENGHITAQERDEWPAKVADYRARGPAYNIQALVDGLVATLESDAGVVLLADMMLFRDAYLDGKPLTLPITGSGAAITLTLEDEGDDG